MTQNHPDIKLQADDMFDTLVSPLFATIANNVTEAYVNGFSDGRTLRLWKCVKDALPEPGTLCLCAAFGHGIWIDSEVEYFPARFTGVEEWQDPADGETIRSPQWLSNPGTPLECLCSDEVSHWFAIPQLQFGQDTPDPDTTVSMTGNPKDNPS